jgi:hypothetical protein
MPQLYEHSHITYQYADDWVDPDELVREMDVLNAMNFTVEVEIELPTIGGATAGAALYAAWIRANFGNLSLGIVAVRHIAQSSSWSQHAYGNAVDVMCSGDLHRTIAYATDANRGPLRIAHLLADPYFPSPLGDHYGHVHADFYPQWGGTPPGHPI